MRKPRDSFTSNESPLAAHSVTRFARPLSIALIVVLAIPCGVILINLAGWVLIPLIPVDQTIVVLGDSSADRATVLLDGKWIGALSDTIESGPRAGQHLGNPQGGFLARQGRHRIQVISAHGDTLSCSFVTKDHYIIEVDFQAREIQPLMRMSD